MRSQATQVDLNIFKARQAQKKEKQENNPRKIFLEEEKLTKIQKAFIKKNMKTIKGLSLQSSGQKVF